MLEAAYRYSQRCEACPSATHSQLGPCCCTCVCAECPGFPIHFRLTLLDRYCSWKQHRRIQVWTSQDPNKTKQPKRNNNKGNRRIWKKKNPNLSEMCKGAYSLSRRHPPLYGPVALITPLLILSLRPSCSPQESEIKLLMSPHRFSRTLTFRDHTVPG